MRSVAILGATGSIGVQALDVVAAQPGLRVRALAAHGNHARLVASAAEHGVRSIALVDPAAAAAARRSFSGTVLEGAEGVVELVRGCGADVVLNAIVGSAGLTASLAALESGGDLALANKESLVAGGRLVTDAARAAGGRLLPVDSEHAALAQCLAGVAPDEVESLVLTASGGPFWDWSHERIAAATPAQALAHPTWSMGAKITVDSATLMNKGLEVIEAHHLFGVDYPAIEVVVHRQSVVHGMVRLRDGAVLMHAGLPDMRVPISWALSHPRRPATNAARLDLARPWSLTFEPPALDRFPCLDLARRAGVSGGVAPCALNAANEVAVGSFLSGAIGFGEIPGVVERVLDAVGSEPVESIAHVLAVDARARAIAAETAGVAA
ncbi:MAG TPA: 1-deoxy-D-xylulose-5-phosphate reductoisomerase [Gaiellales bacterium]|nr:1-deoxy-D-xylulose-5-phosphate reductoisomerase [Gaiellales bacterium]